jgi:hypothetical protein
MNRLYENFRLRYPKLKKKHGYESKGGKFTGQYGQIA